MRFSSLHSYPFLLRRYSLCFSGQLFFSLLFKLMITPANNFPKKIMGSRIAAVIINLSKETRGPRTLTAMTTNTNAVIVRTMTTFILCLYAKTMVIALEHVMYFLHQRAAAGVCFLLVLFLFRWFLKTACRLPQFNAGLLTRFNIHS